MSLGWSNDSNIYSNFQQGVQKQLDARKKLVANLIKDDKGNFSIDNKKNRSILELTYLNSNTGWVKLSSGVDIINPIAKSLTDQQFNDPIIQAAITKASGKKEEKGSNKLARENVLFGGAFNDATKKVRGGFDPTGNNKNSSYNFESQYGFRPMAGITSANIKTQGTFGAIKRATIEFQVNSLEELEKFEKLYMVPGYSVLLEWGHSMILNNKGKLDTLIKTYSNWFVNLPNNDPDNEEHRSAVILKQLEKLRKDQDFNYDALFGKISNYTWSLNPEGTYNCQINITGYGELTESLSAIFTPTQSEEEKNLISEEKINKFTKYLESIQNLIPIGTGDTPISDFRSEYRKIGQNERNILGLRTLSSQFLNYVLLNIKNSGNIKGSTDASCSKFITLGSFLNLINNNFMLQEDGLKWIKFYTGPHKMPDTQRAREARAADDLELEFSILNGYNRTNNNEPYSNKTPFVTFDDHISNDLTVCFLPKCESTTRKLNILFATSPEVHDCIQGDTDDILNIMVNVSHIQTIYLDLIENNKNADINVYDMVDTLLDDIAKSLGNINNFSLESRDQIYYINDRAGIPGRKDITYELDVYGLKGLTSNVTITSSIPSSLSTLIAIGASAGGVGLNENVFNFQSFYKDFIDRIIPVRDIEPATVKKEKVADREKEKAQDAAKLIGKYIRKINAKRNIDNLSRSDVVSAHQILTNLLLKKTLIDRSLNATGVIPIQLSFEMHGISGLRITDVFNLGPGLLPSRYKGNVSFTITGIDNQVSNNRWTTTATGTMMMTTPMDEISEPLEIDIDEVLAEAEVVYPDEILQEGFPNATKVRNLIAANFSSLFSEKGNELTSSGRDIAPNTARLANFLMNDIFEQIKASPPGPTSVRNLRFRWTGGNDSFHVYSPEPPKSTKHRTGLGLDLAIQQNHTSAELAAATKIVRKASDKAKARYPHIYKDEYINASGHATGGHWHFGLGSAGSNEVSGKVTGVPIETKEVSLGELSSKALKIGIT